MATADHPARRDRRRWSVVRRRILARDDYRCRECGGHGRLEVDHIVPVWRGGDRWDESNLQSLCRAHHLAKTRDENTHPDRRVRRDRWAALLDSIR